MYMPETEKTMTAGAVAAPHADARDPGRVPTRPVQNDPADPVEDLTPQEQEQVRQRIKSERDRLAGEFNSYIQNDWTNGP